jgi:hypothetical protein
MGFDAVNRREIHASQTKEVKTRIETRIAASGLRLA